MGNLECLDFARILMGFWEKLIFCHFWCTNILLRLFKEIPSIIDQFASRICAWMCFQQHVQECDFEKYLQECCFLEHAHECTSLKICPKYYFLVVVASFILPKIRNENFVSQMCFLLISCSQIQSQNLLKAERTEKCLHITDSFF